MTTTETPEIAALPCGAPGIVCIDYRDDSNPSDLGGHLHVHAETWRRMFELAEMLEGEDETKGAMDR